MKLINDYLLEGLFFNIPPNNYPDKQWLYYSYALCICTDNYINQMTMFTRHL